MSPDLKAITWHQAVPERRIEPQAEFSMHLSGQNYILGSPGEGEASKEGHLQSVQGPEMLQQMPIGQCQNAPSDILVGQTSNPQNP